MEVAEITQKTGNHNPFELKQAFEIDSIYYSAPVGLCVFDKNLRYVRLNQRFADLNGIPIEKHIGRTVREVLPNLSEQAENALKKVLETGEVLNLEIQGETPAHPGVIHYYDETWSPIKNKKGEILGISVVAIDITKQKKALKDLEKSDELKSKFLSILSHELRNPLASIMMAVSMADRSDISSSKRIHSLDIIRRQTHHMSRLVDDLLDLTRIHKNKIELKKECINVIELVFQCASDHEKNFTSGGIIFSVECDTDSIHMDVDPVRLSQAIGNLLNNAQKFTRAGDTVKVLMERDISNCELLITVSDTGHGIPSALLPEIFEPFVQVENSLVEKRVVSDWDYPL